MNKSESDNKIIYIFSRKNFNKHFELNINLMKSTIIL